jgi:hypothetical protein
MKALWFTFMILVMIFLNILFWGSSIHDFLLGYEQGFADIQDTLGCVSQEDEGVFDYWVVPKMFYRWGYEWGIREGAVNYYQQIRMEGSSC